MFSIIFAIDSQCGYAKEGQIPWYNKEDITHFKNLTLNNVVIMGRDTLNSLPNKFLPNRINIVVSSTLSSCSTHLAFTSFNDALRHAFSYKDKKVFVIGGSRLIQEALRHECFEKMFLTVLDKEYDCDKFLNIPLDRFEVLSETKISNGKILELKGSFYNMFDTTYLELVKSVLENGVIKEDRTGTGTKSLFAKQMTFDISQYIPILTSKFIPWKSCIKELLWFLKGQTNSKILEEQGVRIWEGNSSRKFLDSRNLSHLTEGDIGAGYGFQWRHFGATYLNCDSDYTDQGVDQISYIINELIQNPNSRRIVLSSWNPYDLDKMALHPCHVLVQFYTEEIEGQYYLSAHLYQRSMDLFLGSPWNILSYSILTHYIAKVCEMKPHTLTISTGDVHIYLNHFEQLSQQLENLPYSTTAKLKISDEVLRKTIEELSVSDFDIVDYYHNGKISGKMSV